MSEPRLLCCMMPHGTGLPLLERIFHQLGITRVDLHSARGFFIGADPRGLFSRIERDVLQVVVEEERAEELFDWLYREAHVGTQEGRFLYMARLGHATGYAMPPGVPLEPARPKVGPPLSKGG